MATGTRSSAGGRGQRLRAVLLLAPAIALIGGLTLGLRRVFAAGDATQVTQDVIFGSFLVLALTLVVGAIHVFKDWAIHWRTILTTMYLTSPIIAVVYVVIDLETLRWLVSGIGEVALADTRLRFVIGGLDGLLYGSILGLYLTQLDLRATRFTRAGILRYLVLYVLHAVGLVLITAANLSGGVLSRVTFILFFGLFIALRTGVQWWDKRHPDHQQAFDGAVEPL